MPFAKIARKAMYLLAFAVLGARAATVATVGGTGYETLEAAIAAAEPVDGVITYEICGKAEVSETGWVQVLKSGLANNVTKVAFVGATDDAEICIAQSTSLLADQNYDIDVSFEKLTLSHPNGGWVNDCGNATKFFTVWLRNTGAVDNTVSYTDCVFPNGVSNNQYGKTVFANCKFTSPSDWSLWQTGVGTTEVTGCAFTGKRGIKLYTEGNRGTTGDIELTDTTFVLNDASKAAVEITKPGNVRMTNVSVSGTTAGTIKKNLTDSYATEDKIESVTVAATGTNISGDFTAKAENDVAKEEFNITGGTFTAEVSPDYCADGFEVKVTTDADGKTTYGVVEKTELVNYVTLELVFGSNVAAEDVTAAKALYAQEKFETCKAANEAYMALFGVTWGKGYLDVTDNAAPLYKYAGVSGSVGEVRFYIHGTLAGFTSLQSSGNQMDCTVGGNHQIFRTSYSVIGVDGADGSKAKLTDGNVQAYVAGGYASMFTVSGKLTIDNIEFMSTTSTTVGASATRATESDTENEVASAEMEIKNCTFRGRLYVYDNFENLGKMTYGIHNCVFDGSNYSGDSNAYAIFAQCKGGNNLVIKDNVISGFARGINIDNTNVHATIEGNKISVTDEGRSCIQLSSLATVDIVGNTLELTGGNAITLHEKLLTLGIVPEVTISGNTVTGTGYLIYDDASANNKEFTSDNLKLTYATDNTVAETVDTTKGVKGSTTYVTSTAVNNEIQHYVAQVGTTGYTTLAAALAALTAENHTLTLLNEDAWDAATPVYWAAGTQNGYAATFAAALTAAYKANAGAITVVCRPGADVGTMTHGHVADDLTVYGNNAYISGGECDLEVDTYTFSRTTGAQAAGGVSLDKDITITAYELDNLGVWGQRTTAHTVTVNLTDCDSVQGVTAQRVYISGTTGVNNITLTGCDFLTEKTAVYSNADGAITVKDCSFTGGAAPVNVNHKADGAVSVTVEGCTFTDCGDDGDWKQFAAPIRFVNSGAGTMSASVATTTIAGTVGTNGDILLGDGRTGQKSNDVTLTVTDTAADVQAQKPGYYDGETVDGTKVATVASSASGTLETSVAKLLPNSVAQVGEVKYTTLAEAIDAAKAGDTVTLLDDVTLTEALTLDKDLTLDLGGKTVTAEAVKMTRLSNDGCYAGLIVNGSAQVAVKNGTLTSAYTTYKDGTTSASYSSYVVLVDDTAHLTLDDVRVVGQDAGDNYVRASGGICYDSTGSLTLKSCTVSAGAGNGKGYNYNNPDAIFTVSGCDGTFVVDATTVTGGAATGIKMDKDGSAAINVNGGVDVTVSGGSTLVGGGSAKTAGNALEARGSGTLKVSDSTLQGGSSTDGIGGSALFVNSSTVTAEVTGATLVGGDGGTSYDGSGVSLNKAATVSITDSTVKSGHGENATGNAAAITLADPYLTGGQADLTLSNVRLSGSDRNTVIKNGLTDGIKLTGDVTVDAGTLKNVAISELGENVSIKIAEGAAAEADTIVSLDPDRALVKDSDVLFRADAAVAQVVDSQGNKMSYATLASAIAAAADGETVKLLADIETTETVKVAGKSITLDLGGKTLTSAASGLSVAADATLTVKDSGSGGKIVATGSYSVGIENAGTLIVEGGSVEAVYGAICALGGSTTTINGGTFASSTGRYGMYYWANGTALSVTVNGGVFKHAVSTAMENGKVALSVKGGSFASDLTGYCGADAGTYLDKETGLYVYGKESEHVPAGYVVDENGNVTISDEESLFWFAQQVNVRGNTFTGKTVSLADDIALTAEWTPVGTSVAKSFQGTFDGKDHSITGMKVSGAYQAYGYGFFKLVISATVKNVTFAQAEVKGEYSNVVGGVAGYSYGSSTFENVHVTDSLVYAFGKVGGFVGMAEDAGAKTTFRNCSVEATTIHGGYNVAGFCGLVMGTCEFSGSSLTDVTPIVDEDSQGFGKIVELDTTVACDGSVATCAGTGTVIKGRYIPNNGYYWSAYSDLYNHYGASSHDCTLADGKMLANSEVVHDAPVAIGDARYSDLQAAFDAAQTGDTVTLLSDITLTEQVNITKALDGLTLDGNGKTITCATTTDPFQGGGSALYFGNANDHLYCTGVKIKDLTMTGMARFAIFLCGGTTTEFTNVKISGSYYIAINLYGTHGATLTDCDISNSTTGTDKYISAIWSNVSSANPLTLNNSKVDVIAINAYTTANKLEPKIFVMDGSEVGEIHTFDDGSVSGNKKLCVSTESTGSYVVKEYDEATKTWVNLRIARIGTVGYETLAAALAAAKTGETVTLLGDVVLAGPSGTLYGVADGVTLDLNGHGIDGTNVTLDNATPATLGLNVEVDAAGVVSIVNSGAATATLSGYVPLRVSSVYGDSLKVVVGDNIVLAATAGGMGNGVQLDSNVYLPYGEKTAAFFTNGGFKAVVGGEARIYGAFDSASDVADDTTAVLLNDYTGTDSIKVKKNGKGNASFTLDLNGKTYTYAGYSGYGIVDLDCGKALTVKNGTLTSTKENLQAGVKLEATGAAVTLVDVVLDVAGNYGIATNGSNKDNAVTLRNTTVRAPNGLGVYFPSTGTLTIDGGSITANTGVQLCAGSLVITGEPAITATGTGPGTFASSGSILDGAAVSVVSRAGYGAIEGVSISGGRFTAADGVEALQVYAVSDNAKTEWPDGEDVVNVSGGAYSSAILPAYCALGYIPTANDDGTYGVKKGTYVAQIGTTGYETLEAALAAADAGATVKMLANVVLTAQQTIAKAVVLDLNGKTISTTVNQFITIVKGGDLTVNDATGEGRIENTATDSSSGRVIFMEGGVLTVNGGTLASNSSSAWSYYATIEFKNDSYSTVNIAGGRIESIRTANHADGAIKVNAAAHATVNVSGGEIVGSKGGIHCLNAYSTINISGGTIIGNTGNAVYSGAYNKITISGGTLTPGGTAAALAIGGGSTATSSCTVTIGREGGVVGDVTIPSIDFKPGYSANMAMVNLLSGIVEKFKDFDKMTVATVSQGKDKLLVGTDITACLPGSELLCQLDAESGLYEIVKLTVENAAAIVTHDGTETPYRTVQQAVRAVADGDMLTLKVDHTGSQTLSFSAKNVTVDLGGKTLTYTGATGGLSSALSFNQSTASDNTVTVKNGTIVAKAQDATCVRAEMTGDLSKTLTVVFGENLTLTSGNTSRYGGVVLGTGARTASPCEKMTKGGLLVTEGEKQWIYGETETAFTHANGSEVTLLNDWYCTDYDGAIKVPDTSAFGSAKLNLDGHTIKHYGAGAAIVMGNDAKPDEGTAAKTLEISNGTIKTSLHGAAVCGSNKSLTLDGVALTTTGDKMFGLYANGMTTGNTVTLKNESAVVSEKATGIYFPGAGTLTVEDSNVTGGMSGIEVRAGALNVSGTSVVESTATAFNFTNDDNGITTTGAAVAAVKHTVGNDLAVTITGGTFKGPRGFYANDPNADKEGKVTVSISGGAFSTDVEKDYLADGCKTVQKTIDGTLYYVVGPAITQIEVSLGDVKKLLPFADAWLAANIGADASGWTTAALEADAANGLKTWQCYLFGLDPANADAKIVATAKQGTVESIPLTVANADAATSPLVTGGLVTVTYVLMGSNDNKTWTEQVAEAATPDGLAIPLTGTVYRFYRVDVKVTSAESAEGN